MAATESYSTLFFSLALYRYRGGEYSFPATSQMRKRYRQPQTLRQHQLDTYTNIKILINPEFLR